MNEIRKPGQGDNGGGAFSGGEGRPARPVVPRSINTAGGADHPRVTSPAHMRVNEEQGGGGTEVAILPAVREHFRAVATDRGGRVDAADQRYVAVHGTSVEAVSYMFRTGFLPGVTEAEVPVGYRPRDISAVPTPHTPGTFQENPVEATETNTTVRMEAGKVAERHGFLAQLGIPLDNGRANEMAKYAVDRIWDPEETERSDSYFQELGFSQAEIRRAARIAGRMKGILLGMETFAEGSARTGDLGDYHLFVQPPHEEGFPSDQFNGLEAVGEFDRQFLESALGIRLPRPEIPQEVSRHLNEKRVSSHYPSRIDHVLTVLQSGNYTTEQKQAVLTELPTYTEDTIELVDFLQKGQTPQREAVIDLLTSYDAAVTLDDVADEIHQLASQDPNSPKTVTSVIDYLYTAAQAVYDEVQDTQPLDHSLVRKATDTETVEREITEGIANTGSIFGVVNNFGRTLLPGGTYWQETEADESVRGERLVGRPDAAQRVYHSEQFLRGTYGDLLGAVDRAIEAEGLDRAHFMALRDAGDSEAHLRYGLPVYVRLRTMGFSHYDLSM